MTALSFDDQVRLKNANNPLLEIGVRVEGNGFLGAHDLKALFTHFTASLDFGLSNGTGMHIGAARGQTTLQLVNAPGVSLVGTATNRGMSDTQVAARYQRIGAVSAAPAGSLAGIRHNAAPMFTATASVGGYLSNFRFNVSDPAAVAGARGFYGLQASLNAPSNVEPDTQTQCIGVGQLSTDDTQLYLIAAGASAQAAMPLGVMFPAVVNGAIDSHPPYELSVLSKPGVALWSLTRLDTMYVTGGILSEAQRPTLFQCVNSWRTNNATALAVGFDWINWNAVNNVA